MPANPFIGRTNDQPPTEDEMEFLMSRVRGDDELGLVQLGDWFSCCLCWAHSSDTGCTIAELGHNTYRWNGQTMQCVRSGPQLGRVVAPLPLP